MMLGEQEKEIFQFLAGNWYSRPENDHEIVEEIVDSIRPEELYQQIDLIRHYLAGPDSTADKSAFIRKSVQRYIPETIDAPINWLDGIIRLLEQSLKKN